MGDMTQLATCNQSLEDILGGDETVILFFSAPWSQQCANVEALVETEFLAEADRVIRINVETYQYIATRYDITSLPTAVCIADGEEKARATGVDISAFEDAVRQLS